MPINIPFKKKKYTTQGLYIGKPEAEAERETLHELFRDYMDIEGSIKRGSFLITGRKGAGKSAYAMWLLDKSQSDDSLYCSLVKKNEFSLEEMIQSLESQKLRYDALFEWIILVRLVKLVIDSNVGTYLPQSSALRKFYEKNAGFVNIDKYVITEILSNKEVNFSPLKGQFGFFSRVFGNKSVKAPFYQMVSPLRDTLIEVLSMPIFKDVKFYVMFDDLDVKFKLNREDDKIMLMDLIRTARRYNTEYLHNTTARVLLFVRDDIGDRLEGVDSDKNKIFSSYEHCINWYETDVAQKDETSIMLRRFINHRLEVGFNACGIEYDVTDPWKSFVKEDEEDGQKSSFKYILDHTFYLPRDLITIFKDVGKKALPLPLSHQDINYLLKDFANAKKQEICDELYAVYDKDEVNKIFLFLERVNNGWNVSYKDVMCYLDEYGINKNEFHTLIEYSLLVPVSKYYNHLFYSYRESSISKNYEQYTYRPPKILKLYFNNMH